MTRSLSLLLGSMVSLALTSGGLPGMAAGRQESQERIALVIGNSAYSSSPLRNPVNDARAMGQVLEDAGFDVILGEDLSQNEMKRVIREFGERLNSATVGLFYYAGHGMQVAGRNYLVPVSAVINSEPEVEYESVDVGLVLAQMEAARSRLNIVVLDACRDNPFSRGFRSTVRGLASIDAPLGTIIAYATAPGSLASDGDGDNGLYTEELIRNLQVPGLKIEDVFKRVRQGVQGRTGGRQVPWESSSLTSDFFFYPGAEPAGGLPAADSASPVTGSGRGLALSAEPFLGSWAAAVTYHPESRYGAVTRNERFNFLLFGNTLQGSASYTEFDLAVVNAGIEEGQLSFVTRSAERIHYQGVLSEDGIRFMLRTEGDENQYLPVYFTAERVSLEPGEPFESISRVRSARLEGEGVPPTESLRGSWVAEVTYGREWVSPTYTERFDFIPFGQTVQGTASSLGWESVIMDGALEGNQLTFITQTTSDGREQREWSNVAYGSKLTHHYVGLISENEIRFMMRTDGDDRTYPPIFFTAQRESVNRGSPRSTASNRIR